MSVESDSIRHAPLAMDAAKFRALGHRLVDQVAEFLESLPRGPVTRSEGTLAVGEAFKKYGIKDALIAGGHGTTVKQAEIGAALGVEVSSR